MMIAESREVLETDAQCILLHGPPFVGKTYYAEKVLRVAYVRVCPDEIFKSQPELSLRQLIHQFIVQPLKKGKKVVIDGSSQTSSIRKSYADLIHNKVPGVKLVCVVLTPAHGHEQLLWQQEFRAAECLLMGDTAGCQNILSTSVAAWYHKRDAVLAAEGFDIIRVKTQLCVKTPSKLHMPCLLLDWPLEISKALIDALTHWHKLNTCGRVIAVCESTSSTTEMLAERSSSNKSEMDRLTSKLTFPVSMFTCTDARSTASPLAFLLQSLCLDLCAPTSVCVYNGSALRAAAHSAGMKCIKASRLLQNHTLIHHGLERGGMSAMLHNMRVDNAMLDEKLQEALRDPLWFHINSTAAQACARSIYMSAKDRTVLTRYKEINSGIGHQFSAQDAGMSAEVLNNTNAAAADWLTSNPAAVKQTKVRGEFKQRTSGKLLPQWMRSAGAKHGIYQHGILLQHGRLRRHRPRLNKTMYLMSESELVKAATYYIKNFKEQDVGEMSVVVNEKNTRLAYAQMKSCGDRESENNSSIHQSDKSSTTSQLPKKTHKNPAELFYEDTEDNGQCSNIKLSTSFQTTVDNSFVTSDLGNSVAKATHRNSIQPNLVSSSCAHNSILLTDDDNFDEFINSLC